MIAFHHILKGTSARCRRRRQRSHCSRLQGYCPRKPVKLSPQSAYSYRKIILIYLYLQGTVSILRHSAWLTQCSLLPLVHAETSPPLAASEILRWPNVLLSSSFKFTHVQKSYSRAWIFFLGENVALMNWKYNSLNPGMCNYRIFLSTEDE